MLIALVTAVSLSGCDLGRVPAAERATTGAPEPRYLAEAELDLVYRYADDMITVSKAVTKAKVRACERLAPAAAVDRWRDCWERLLVPYEVALRAFGRSTIGLHDPALSERCRRALSRITLQAEGAARILRDLLIGLGSPRAADRAETAKVVRDRLDQAEDDVNGTYTRFDRHCIDPADREAQGPEST